MNKKGIIAIGLAALLLICAGVIFALNGGGKPENNTTSLSESSSVQPSQGNQSTAADAQSTTAPVTEDASQYAFLRQGCWYIYNDSAKTAMAFQFTDEDDLVIAFFDEANVMGEDAKYFKGDAEYKIVDGNVVIEDIPEDIGIPSIMLTVSGETLTHGDITLEHYDELSLEPAFNHFN